MEEKKHSKFGRTVLLVALAAVLGGGTLGGGLGVGIAVMNRILPQEEQAAAEESQPVFNAATAEPTVVPINYELPDYSEMITSAKEFVVSINVMANVQSFFGTQTTPAAGSGFIYSVDDENVYIATNNHVVAESNSITISLDDKENVPARLIGRDPSSELAVIAVSKEDMDALGIPYRAAELGDSSELSVGDPVVAMGNAMGEGQTATQGIISAESKEIEIDGVTLEMLQTDAAINQGNSGGPLVNAEGKVVGINTAKTVQTGVEGMGYSIPINDAVEILKTLRDDGVVPKPYLGIGNFQDITEQHMEMFNMPSMGVMFETVAEDSPAAEAGFESYDVISEFSGEAVTGYEQLVELVANTKVGDEVSVTVYRGTEKLQLTVVIGNANESYGGAALSEPSEESAEEPVNPFGSQSGEPINPFGDSSGESVNPFGDSSGESVNPFGDPSFNPFQD